MDDPREVDLVESSVYTEASQSGSEVEIQDGKNPLVSEPKPKKSLSFGSVLHRYYAQGLGSCGVPGSQGPTVGIDWSYKDCESFNIDDYEQFVSTTRRERQNFHSEGKLNFLDRVWILQRAGLKDEEIEASSEEMKNIRTSRRMNMIDGIDGDNPEGLHYDFSSPAGKKNKKSKKDGEAKYISDVRRRSLSEKNFFKEESITAVIVPIGRRTLSNLHEKKLSNTLPSLVVNGKQPMPAAISLHHVKQNINTIGQKHNAVEPMNHEGIMMRDRSKSVSSPALTSLTITSTKNNNLNPILINNMKVIK